MSTCGKRLARLEAAAETRAESALMAYLQGEGDDEFIRLARARHLPLRMQARWDEVSALSDEQLLAVLLEAAGP